MPKSDLTLDDIRDFCKESWLCYILWHDAVERNMPDAPKMTHGLMGIAEMATRLAIGTELITEDGVKDFQ